MDPQSLHRMLTESRHVPADVFADVSAYAFPSLAKDLRGFFSTADDKLAAYDTFRISPGERPHVVFDSGKYSRDEALEEYIWGSRLGEFTIDMQDGGTEFVKTTRCLVHPESIKHSPAYDVLYCADQTLKTIWRMMIHALCHGNFAPDNEFVLSAERVDGGYNVCRVIDMPAFVTLKNALRLFQLKNKLRMEDACARFDKYRGRLSQGEICFAPGEYAIQENVLVVHPLKVQFCIRWADGSEYAADGPAWYLKQFMEEHFDYVEKAFPIYKRLKAMYRLCIVNQALGNAAYADDSTKTYIESYPDSILMRGGINASAKTAKQASWIPELTCKQVFDLAGTACAFAPKLHIRKCYENAEKEFLECMKSE